MIIVVLGRWFWLNQVHPWVWQPNMVKTLKEFTLMQGLIYWTTTSFIGVESEKLLNIISGLLTYKIFPLLLYWSFILNIYILGIR